MSPEELLHKVYKEIDRWFAEGHDLSEVLGRIEGFIESLETA
jgi:hypothetical protein